MPTIKLIERSMMGIAYIEGIIKITILPTNAIIFENSSLLVETQVNILFIRALSELNNDTR